MSKTIHATEQDRETHRLLTKILGLEDLDIVKSERHPEEKLLVLYCVSRWGVGVCPECMHLATKTHDYPNPVNALFMKHLCVDIKQR